MSDKSRKYGHVHGSLLSSVYRDVLSMNIGIDARMLGKGYGIGRYIEELIVHLNDQDTDHSFVIFVSADSDTTSLHLEKNMRTVVAPVPWYSFAEQCKMPNIIARENVDLMHFPHWNMPLLYRGPFVVTIHDLTMFHHSRMEATTRNPLTYWIKDRVHRFLVKHAVKQAAHIITPSQWVAQDVAKTCNVDPKKITTVYEAPTLSKSKKKRDGKYVLYVGAAYPHKNLPVLLQAWKAVEEHIDDVTLLLAGKDSAFYDRLKQSTDWITLQRVEHLGFVPDAQLPALYAGASAFVFPSISEGFGIPPLEAMQQGTPVIASSASCLPEVLGDAALYIDPTNPDALADAIIQLLENPDLHHDLVQAGRAQVNRYSWSAAASQILGICEMCTTDRNPGKNMV